MIMLILYDVSRIIKLGSRSSPTGIDRVDIEILNNIKKISQVETVYVIQKYDAFFLVDAEQFSDFFLLLNQVWNDASEVLHQKMSLLSQEIMTEIESKRRQSSSLLCRRLEAKLGSREYSNKVYINISHSGLENYYGLRVLKRQFGFKMVFFIHDLIPIDFPEFSGPGMKKLHKWRLLSARLLSDLVVVNSQDTKQRTLSYWSSRKPANTSVEVLPLGVKSEFLAPPVAYTRAQNEYLADPYFVVLGTLEPRKNHAVLISAWNDLLADRHSEQGVPRLVIIGKRGWLQAQEFQQLREFVDSHQFVELYSEMPDADLLRYLTGANAILFPSFTEGYGLPLIEAAALSVPVVCTDISVFREVTEDKAVYLGANQPEQWSEQVRLLSTDMAYRQSCVENISQVSVRSWAGTQAPLENLLKRLFENPEVQMDASWAAHVDQVIYFLILLKCDRALKRIKKLFRDPHAYYFDSRFSLLRKLSVLFVPKSKERFQEYRK